MRYHIGDGPGDGSEGLKAKRSQAQDLEDRALSTKHISHVRGVAGMDMNEQQEQMNDDYVQNQLRHPTIKSVYSQTNVSPSNDDKYPPFSATAQSVGRNYKSGANIINVRGSGAAQSPTDQNLHTIQYHEVLQAAASSAALAGDRRTRKRTKDRKSQGFITTIHNVDQSSGSRPTLVTGDEDQSQQRAPQPPGYSATSTLNPAYRVKPRTAGADRRR